MTKVDEFDELADACIQNVAGILIRQHPDMSSLATGAALMRAAAAIWHERFKNCHADEQSKDVFRNYLVRAFDIALKENRK